jgi:hypothetical protein
LDTRAVGDYSMLEVVRGHDRHLFKNLPVVVNLIFPGAP